MTARNLALGDIHGCFAALTALMDVVRLQPDDRLIALGDYIDRGPDSRAVLEWLIQRQAAAPLVALRGNHEEMLMAAREGDEYLEMWLGYGGREALASYSLPPDASGLAGIPNAHWQFVDQTQLWWETDTHFFVHANAYPDVPLERQPRMMLLWESLLNPRPHISGKTMVCGHTPQKSGRPLNRGHTICIDTWVYGQGWLTCLDVATGQYWQANQQGQTRDGLLGRPSRP